MKFVLRHRLEIGVSIVFYVGLWAASHNQPISTVLSNISQKVLILALAAFAGLVIALVRYRAEIQIVLAMHEGTRAELRGTLAKLLRKQLIDLKQAAAALTGGPGSEFTRDGLDKLSAACFEANRGWHYVGTDSNIPSAYLELYPSYLDQHFRSSRDSRLFNDYRILLVAEADLYTDFESKPALFEQFYKSHVLNQVKLLHVDHDWAVQEARRLGLVSADFGLFGAGFVAFFNSVRKGARFRVWLESLGTHQKALREFLLSLNKQAREIRIENGRLRLTRTAADIDADEYNIFQCLT